MATHTCAQLPLPVTYACHPAMTVMAELLLQELLPAHKHVPPDKMAFVRHTSPDVSSEPIEISLAEPKQMRIFLWSCCTPATQKMQHQDQRSIWHTTMLDLATDQPSPASSLQKQAAAYYRCLLPYAQVLICLDEFTKDNGGTMFMPGSHKHKPEGIEADEEGTLDGSVVLEAPAGSVLIAHSAWWYVLVALYMPSVLSQTLHIATYLL